jgi:hypothetical protein
MDLVCGPHVARTAHDLVLRWGRDRALSAAALGRLSALVLAAMAHGLRFDPRRVGIAMRWIDLDRVRVDVTWKGCSATAVPSAIDDEELDATAETLDTYAAEWGFGTGRTGPIQWMVLDTRRCNSDARLL